MRVVVVEGPKPIVAPKDIPGDHEPTDEFVASVIAAVQGEIDGPTGWLRRSLGAQTIELHLDAWPASLPFGPVIEVVSAEADGVPAEGVSLDRRGRLVVPPNTASGDVVILYRAGYDGRGHEDGGTGPVPPNARMAVILGAKMLCSMGDKDIFVQQEQVNGVGSTSRNVTPYVAETIERAVGNLLAPLRVWA